MLLLLHLRWGMKYCNQRVCIFCLFGMYRSGPWAGAGGGPMSREAELNNHWRLKLNETNKVIIDITH